MKMAASRPAARQTPETDRPWTRGWQIKMETRGKDSITRQRQLMTEKFAPHPDM